MRKTGKIVWKPKAAYDVARSLWSPWTPPPRKWIVFFSFGLIWIGKDNEYTLGYTENFFSQADHRVFHLFCFKLWVRNKVGVRGKYVQSPVFCIHWHSLLYKGWKIRNSFIQRLRNYKVDGFFAYNNNYNNNCRAFYYFYMFLNCSHNVRCSEDYYRL